MYFQDARSDLSYLAHHASEVDKYRAESCGVIGMHTLNTSFCIHIWFLHLMTLSII